MQTKYNQSTSCVLGFTLLSYKETNTPLSHLHFYREDCATAITMKFNNTGLL